MKDFSTIITPRFYETDALGHINNAAIAAWFEVARINFLESLEEGPDTARCWILASLHIDFVLETFYGEDVKAVITGIKLGNSSLTVICEMSQQHKVTVKGTAVLVYLDPQSTAPVRIPEQLRQQLEAL